MGVGLGDSATIKPSRASSFGEEEDEQAVMHQIQRQDAEEHITVSTGTISQDGEPVSEMRDH